MDRQNHEKTRHHGGTEGAMAATAYTRWSQQVRRRFVDRLPVRHGRRREIRQENLVFDAQIESTGSGGGIKLFCNGVGLNTPDITNASRRIKKSEFDMCRKTASRTSSKCISASTASRSPTRTGRSTGTDPSRCSSRWPTVPDPDGSEIAGRKTRTRPGKRQPGTAGRGDRSPRSAADLRNPRRLCRACAGSRLQHLRLDQGNEERRTRKNTRKSATRCVKTALRRSRRKR